MKVLTNKALLSLTDDDIRQLGALQRKRVRTTIAKRIDDISNLISKYRQEDDIEEMNQLARTKAALANIKSKIPST